MIKYRELMKKETAPEGWSYVEQKKAADIRDSRLLFKKKTEHKVQLDCFRGQKIEYCRVDSERKGRRHGAWRLIILSVLSRAKTQQI